VSVIACEERFGLALATTAIGCLYLGSIRSVARSLLIPSDRGDRRQPARLAPPDTPPGVIIVRSPTLGASDIPRRAG